MNRFVNASKLDYYNSTIRSFSEDYSPMFSGVSRGYMGGKKEWIGDMLYNNSENDLVNNHRGYMTFYNNHDFTIQRFNNTFDNLEYIGDVYKFFNDHTDNGVKYEMSTTQYNIVGQKGYSSIDITLTGFDNTELIAYSDLTTDDPNSNEPDTVFTDRVYESNYMYYGMYIRYSLNTDDNRDVRTKYLLIPDAYYDIYDYNDYTELKFETVADKGGIYNMYDNESNTAGPGRVFIYSKYDNDYKQYYGKLFGDTYKLSVDAMDYTYPSMFSSNIEDGFRVDMNTQYPETYRRGVIHNQKSVSVTESYCERTNHNPIVNNSELWDQNRFLFSFPSSMLTYSEKSNQVIDGDVKVTGIDLYTEANLRMSSTITTEPYMTTKPLADGQVVQYKFVDRELKDSNNDPNANVQVIIKAPNSFIKEIDEKIQRSEVNTDIIETVVVRYNTTLFTNNNTEPYLHFGSHISDLYKRANIGVFDIINGEVRYENGIIGGSYHQFTAVNTGPYSDKYTDGKMLAGMGIQPTDNGQRVALYFSNFKSDDYAVIADESSGVTSVKTGAAYTGDPYSKYNLVSSNRYEIFKPMIRISNSRGYIKLISRNSAHRVKKLSDGNVEAVYYIEIPFAYNMSNSIRSTVGYQNTTVRYKDTYINAGSNEVVDGKMDLYNNRYIPFGDDFTGPTQIYKNKRTEEISINDVDYSETEVWTSLPSTYFSITSFDPDRRFGTIEYGNHNDPTKDVAVLIKVDNRGWSTKIGKLPYIGMENPTFEFNINLENLYGNMDLDYINNISLPDIKRYVYENYIGGASVMPVNPETHANLAPITKNGLYDVEPSGASLILEVFDRVANCWRPLSISGSDNEVVSATPIIEDLAIKESTYIPGTEYDIVEAEIIMYTSDGQYHIPCDLWNESKNPIRNASLVDSATGEVFKVIHSKGTGECSDDSSFNNQLQVFTMYIKIKSDKREDFTTRNNVENLINGGQLSLRQTASMVNDSTSNNIISGTTVGSNNNINLMYLDIRKDMDRYVDNNFIRVRALVLNNALSEVYYVDRDTSMIQDTFYNNNILKINPWVTSGVYDYKFDWSKVKLSTMVDKLRASYFKLASV